VEFDFLYMPKIKTEITVITVEQILETVKRTKMAGSFRGGHTGLDVWDYCNRKKVIPLQA
jgi:hypothetical protein